MDSTGDTVAYSLVHEPLRGTPRSEQTVAEREDLWRILEHAEAESLEYFARRVETLVQFGMPVGDLLDAYPTPGN